jgi:hypothetical protein
MSDPGDRIAIRTSSLFLTVLLSLTPATQVLAQAEQQGQESKASQTESDENSELGAVSQDGERDAALPNSRVAEADTVQLLRLGATVFFPETDSPPLFDSAAATAKVFDLPSGTDILIGLAIIAVLVLIAWAYCSSNPCGSTA